MREIKFRGKSLDNGMMVYGNLSVQYDGTWIDCGNGVEARWVHVDPDTVGQYTGLNSKNARECYEGDTAKEGNTEYLIVWSHEKAQFGAKVIKTKYVLTHGLTFPLWQYVDQTSGDLRFEVIRDSNDNPELLAPKEGADKHETN